MPRLGDRLEALEWNRALACLARAVGAVVEAAEGVLDIGDRVSRQVGCEAGRLAVASDVVVDVRVSEVASTSLCSKLRRR